ncbi:MAG: hypothetical protein RSD70_08105, partial [Acidaminococcaceae bacterium]
GSPSGNTAPGIWMHSTNKLTIEGKGKLIAKGSSLWPGIGREGGGNLEIKDGVIEAVGGENAAAIGGSYGMFESCNVTISGGSVTAIGGYAAAGIGYGGLGTSGTFSTGKNGNAFVDASIISNKNEIASWSGVVFEGNVGKVYGTSVTLNTNATIPSGKTLEIESGKTLNIGTGVTLTNNGIINNSGTLTKIGTGTIDGTGTVNTSSSVVVSFSESSTTYGKEITLTATTQKKAGRSAATGKVDFYLGDVATGTKLGTVDVTAGSGTVTATLKMTMPVWETYGASWTMGGSGNTITADFGGGSGLMASTGTSNLTVNKAPQITPSAPTAAKVTANTITLNAASETSKGAVKYGYTVGLESTPGHWQTDVTFTKLSPNTQYTFYTRFEGTEHYETT